METQAFDGEVTNGESIVGNTSTQTYKPSVSNSVTTEKADVGFSVSGKISLDDTNKQALLTNFYVRFAARTNDADSIAAETYVSRQSMILELDKPYVIASRTVSLDQKSKGQNFIFAGKNTNESVSSNFIIVISASRIDREKAENTQKPAEPEGLQSNPSLTVAQAVAAPVGFVINSQDGVLSNTLFGQVAGFRLLPETVSLELANTTIFVKETNQITNKSKLTPVKLETLVRHGYPFLTNTYTALQETCPKVEQHCEVIPITVSLLKDETSNSPILASFKMRYLPGLKDVTVGKIEHSADQRPAFRWSNQTRN